MKFFTSILFPFCLVLSLVTLPTSNVMACGGACCKKENTEEVEKNFEKNTTQKEKSCCCKKKNDTQKDNDEKDGCGGNCSNDGCQCSSPTVSFVSTFLTYSIVFQSVAPNFHLSKMNWYFEKKMPNPVYLSVWLPPKISC